MATTTPGKAQSATGPQTATVPVGLGPRLTLPLRPPPNPLPTIERLLRRDEADVALVVGNIALVVFEVIEWPVAALTLAVHWLARTRFKGLEALGEVAEEAE